MGYEGAITSGKTICGALFGGAAFLGYLAGQSATEAPEVKDERRTQAIGWVGALFNGFIERFGETQCQTLIGCDWSKKEDIKRYFREEIYKDTCYHYFEYVIAGCVARIDSTGQAIGDP